MTTEVKLFATLRLKLGRGALTIESSAPLTVRELIREVSRRTESEVAPYLLNDDGSLQTGTMILVDGKNIHHLDGLETVVRSQEVSIFPPAGGG